MIYSTESSSAKAIKYTLVCNPYLLRRTKQGWRVQWPCRGWFITSGWVLRQQDSGSPSLLWKQPPVAVTAGASKGEFGLDPWARLRRNSL